MQVIENKENIIEQAKAECKALAQNHYENFPVGRLIRADLRPDVHAIYAFARQADDFADEAQYEGRRLELLSNWKVLLEKAYLGQSQSGLFLALEQSILKHDLPKAWLIDLIEAFEFDVLNNRHQNFESLLNYASKSANPVGRLVLWLHGYRSDELFEYSDNICTALQLANFWQDVDIDRLKNRIYLPQDLLKTYGYSEKKLFNRVYDGSFKDLMKHLIFRTDELFLKGQPLCDALDGRLSMEIKMVYLGGTRILRKIEGVDYNVFFNRPTHGWFDWVKMAAGLMLWKQR